MRQAVAMIARKAEAMDIEVSLGALEAFYQKYDPSKLDGIDEIYEKYPAYKLVQILKKKYGAAPEFTKKTPAKPKKVRLIALNGVWSGLDGIVEGLGRSVMTSGGL